jgi:hypothetical protein
MSNWLHVDIFHVLFTNLMYIILYSFRMLGNFFEVLNFIWLFLKLNQFICNYIKYDI